MNTDCQGIKIKLRVTCCEFKRKRNNKGILMDWVARVPNSLLSGGMEIKTRNP